MALEPRGEDHAAVLGQRARILGEARHEFLRVFAAVVEPHGAGLGAGEEQQLLNDLVQAGNLLELHLHGLLLGGREPALGEQFLGVQPHERERGF